jgi:hypothetical protein
MPNPLVSLRRDQLIPVNKAVNEKEQLDKRAGGGGGKKCLKNDFFLAKSCLTYLEQILLIATRFGVFQKLIRAYLLF